VGDLTGLKTDETVEAGDLLVLPGGVDIHVHFNDAFMNTISVHDYYTGMLSAAYGGTTTVIDFSDQAPGATLMSTIDAKHAVRILGLGEESLVSLPLDADRRIDIKGLQQIVGGLSATRDIFCMVATAGTTKVGAVDPINAMADVCAEIVAWLHVDGAPLLAPFSILFTSAT
jgi:hypothetical protein